MKRYHFVILVFISITVLFFEVADALAGRTWYVSNNECAYLEVPDGTSLCGYSMDCFFGDVIPKSGYRMVRFWEGYAEDEGLIIHTAYYDPGTWPIEQHYVQGTTCIADCKHMFPQWFRVHTYHDNQWIVSSVLYNNYQGTPAYWDYPVYQALLDAYAVKPIPILHTSDPIPDVETCVLDCDDFFINNYSASKTEVMANTDDTIQLTADITTSETGTVYWDLTISGTDVDGQNHARTLSDSGTVLDFTWNLKDDDGKYFGAGAYTAELFTWVDINSNGVFDEGIDCSDNESLTITIQPPPRTCKLKIPFGSTANVASGNVSNSQHLLSVQGTSITTNITLSYNSLDGHLGPIGAGWGHSYEILLHEDTDGVVVARFGMSRQKLYTPDGSGGYTQSIGDYSSLAKNPDSTFTITEKNGTQYNFNIEGKIATIVDRNGNTQTFSYTNGFLTSISDPSGRITTLNYDPNNLLASIIDPAGNTYQFDVTGNTLNSITNPDGGQWLYTYDTNGLMLTKADPAGNTTIYTYDTEGRAETSTDPEEKTRSITYPTDNGDIRTSTFTDKDGSVTQLSYEVQTGNLVSKVDPAGGTSANTYDENNNLLSETDAAGRTTTYTYDANGNRTSVTNPLDQTTTYTYNEYGQVTSITEPDSNVTNYVYDAAGNLTSLTDPTGATTTYQYDAAGRIISVTNALQQTMTMTYDAQGNLSSVTDYAGATTTFTYDALGNRTDQTDAAGNTTTFTYDFRGNLLSVTDPLGHTTTYSYDFNGNRISQTDANGNTTNFEHNFQNQVIQIQDPLSSLTQFNYGSSGCGSCSGGVDKLLSVVDANGNTTSYTYDSLGRLISETDPLGNVTSYSYDTAGNMISRTDGNGNMTAYSYDLLGRLLSKTYPGGATETFTYDTNGNMVTAANQYISYTMTYDADGRLLALSDSNGKSISYVYDQLGNKTTMTSDGQTYTYTYDANNRLTGIFSPAGNFSFTYDNTGKRKSLGYPNGIVTNYTYDNNSRLINLVINNNRKILSQYSYTHDNIGNRLTKVEDDKHYGYGYDAVYHLQNATLDQELQESYGYDPVGNRLSGPVASDSYSYNNGNQLTSKTDAQYAYDDNGNLVSKTTPEGTTIYLYDYENRLVQVTLPDGTVVTLKYDPFGRRIEKSVNGVPTKYFSDQEDILFEYDGAGNITRKYVHGPGVDEPLAVEMSGSFYFYHADGLGSIVFLTKNNRKLEETYSYDSFGRPQESTFSQPYSFTGREWDTETGLYYYRARYYDPAAGRFISRDPIGFEGVNVKGIKGIKGKWGQA